MGFYSPVQSVPEYRTLNVVPKFADLGTVDTGHASTMISTMLTPLEQVRVDVAADGAYTAVHRTSVDELVQDLRTQRSGAVLVSVSKYDPINTARMAAMVREFPRVPAYALLTDERKSDPHSVLSLGQVGIRTLIDARYPSGWDKLRQLLLQTQANDIQRVALAEISTDLALANLDCIKFFELLFCHQPYITTVRQLGRCVCVLPATLLSRFYRAKLPSPKQYIDVVRLIRAARLLENSGLSVSSVSRQLDYSSPQAFSRHTRCVLQLSPVQFRQQFTGESMLQLFRERFILPYVERWQTFQPVAPDPSWLAETSHHHHEWRDHAIRATI